MTEKQYPELPTHFMLVQESFHDEVYLYTADQMRAYVDADRVMRAAPAPAAQVDALDQGVREELSIGKAINRAARDLPEGWEIRIDLERHAGVVFLIDPNGNVGTVYGGGVATERGYKFKKTMSEGGELFSDQINAAIDAAMGEPS